MCLLGLHGKTDALVDRVFSYLPVCTARSAVRTGTFGCLAKSLFSYKYLR